jgi:plasmid replication initiation protein
MLTISADYFNLQKPTDRRIYELARKHCGNQSIWRIKLENLKEKIGSTSSIRKFRFNIKKVTETNHLPEYNIAIEDDVVTFTRKALPKENNLPEQLPQYITKNTPYQETAAERIAKQKKRAQQEAQRGKISYEEWVKRMKQQFGDQFKETPLPNALSRSKAWFGKAHPDARCLATQSVAV